jgi:hypothetical protein
MNAILLCVYVMWLSNRRWVKLTARLYLVPRLTISGAALVLTICVSMLWSTITACNFSQSDTRAATNWRHGSPLSQYNNLSSPTADQFS